MKNDKKETKKSGDDELKNLKVIELLKPKFDKDYPVFKVLQQRKTIREISDKKISLQTLSNLLWAACGVNRKIGPFGVTGRTAATASNSQEIDVYVAMEDGIYFYDAYKHKLIPVVAGDLRALAIGKGQLSLGDKAPVRLIYVADVDKLANTKGYQEPGLQNQEVQKSYYFVDTGIIAGNVYLYAASQGLASWFHNCNKTELASKLKLRAEQRALFGHTIGYPLKKK